MSKTYREWVPDQTYMFPPSPRDWLPENDLVYFPYGYCRDARPDAHLCPL